MLKSNEIHLGNSEELAKQLDDNSVDMMITSPPYFNLRDYGVDGQIGLEEHPNAYINRLVGLFRELRRALKKTGSFYLNLGDSYCNVGSESGLDEERNTGIKSFEGIQRRTTVKQDGSNWLVPKQLLMIPSRVAIAMQDDGWILRNFIVWHKPNAMPSSTTDRLKPTWEPMFHFVKSRKYFYDLDAIREPHSEESLKDVRRRGEVLRTDTNFKGFSVGYGSGKGSKWYGTEGSHDTKERFRGEFYHPEGKNPGDVEVEKDDPVAYFQSKGSGGNVHLYDKENLNLHPQGKNPGDVSVVDEYNNDDKEPGKKGRSRDSILITNRPPGYVGHSIGKNPGDVEVDDNDDNKLPFIQPKWRDGDLDAEVWSSRAGFFRYGEAQYAYHPLGKNPGDFWSVNVRPFHEAHFATYPLLLLKKPILASVPDEVCKKCGAPREKIIEREGVKYDEVDYKPGKKSENLEGYNKTRSIRQMFDSIGTFNYKIVGYTDCGCGVGFEGGLALDPFCGAGSTVVALRKWKPNARWIGFELNKEYIDIAYKRIGRVKMEGGLWNFAKK